MKNLAKLLVMALLVGLFGVVAISSLLATPTVQTPLVATTSYNVETGIRWNEGLGVFEVFNANGVSYIASNEYFDASGTKGISTENGMVKADGSKTYNIMQDIAYNPADIDNLETAFKTGTRHNITTGAVNGRGFILKNFPVVASDTAGTALFRENNGTIQNLILENPTYTDGTGNTGILVYKNTGVIDGCEVKGTINTTNVINIASIAYTGNGTIRNCTNYLNIITNGQYLAGIAGNADSPTLSTNKNYGAIRSNAANSIVGGIAAKLSLGDVFDNTNYGDITANDAGGILGTCVAAKVKSNGNFGNVTGSFTACGIVGGEVYSLTQAGNVNFGDLMARKTAPIYLGEDVTEYKPYGIHYIRGEEITPADGDNPAVYEPGVFMIESMVGLSYIGSGVYFNNDGDISDAQDEFAAPASLTDTTYVITKDINYTEIGVLSNAPLLLGNGSKIDGQDHELRNFPIRKINDTSTYTALFASIANNALAMNIKLTIDPADPVEQTTIDIGLFSYSNSGTIQACEVSGSISTALPRNIGGIAFTGSSQAKFTNCVNRVNMKSCALNIAGIIAKANTGETTTITDCINEGSIISENVLHASSVQIGGIAGIVNNAIIKGCKNNGNVTLISSTAGGTRLIGGIIGYAVTSGDIRQCENNGIITLQPGQSGSTSRGIGGIMGWSGGSQIAVDCVNSSKASIVVIGGASGINIGGLFGVFSGSVNNFGNVVSENTGVSVNATKNNVILACTNFGSINVLNIAAGVNHQVGGITGYSGFVAAGGFTYKNCENRGVINFGSERQPFNGKVIAGGIAGLAAGGDSQSNGNFENCGNYASLVVSKTDSYLGGIVGKSENEMALITSTNNTNAGNIESPDNPNNNTGSFAGYIANASLSSISCNNTGTVSSGRAVGYFPPVEQE